jgi:ABC-type uncharacterized transport system substrate-binding protein
MGIQLVEFGATSPQDLQAEMNSLVTSDGVGIDAILMIAEPLAITQPFYEVLGKFSYKHQIPIGGAPMSIDGANISGEDGSIFGLLPRPDVAGGQAAVIADKIFKGSAAGSIPVSTADGYFQINYKAAQAFGLTVPDGLLKQADEIIR